MTEPTGGKKNKKWYIALVAVAATLLTFFANVDGTIGFFSRIFSTNEAGAAGSTGDGGVDFTTSAPSETTPVQAAEPTIVKDDQTTAAPTTTERGTTQPQPAPRTTEGWFELTAYRSVAFGNGHDSVNTINIGTGAKPFPDSIRGSYSSSASSPDNNRTWLVGGHCTRLSVWVGKDAASSHTAGIGRFIIKAEDIEIHAVEATITDAPVHIDLDITGVVRLTLFDTRAGQDANNAWGSPRVHCTEPPGEAR
ncbi:NPCBM/NEW2 domain-containing protein [Actinophytocola sediminis]